MGDGADPEDWMDRGIFFVFRELCMDLDDNIRLIKMVGIDEHTLMEMYSVTLRR